MKRHVIPPIICLSIFCCMTEASLLFQSNCALSFPISIPVSDMDHCLCNLRQCGGISRASCDGLVVCGIPFLARCGEVHSPIGPIALQGIAAQNYCRTFSFLWLRLSCCMLFVSLDVDEDCDCISGAVCEVFSILHSPSRLISAFLHLPD